MSDLEGRGPADDRDTTGASVGGQQDHSVGGASSGDVPDGGDADGGVADRRLADLLGRMTIDDTTLTPPPPDIWDGIQRDLRQAPKPPVLAADPHRSARENRAAGETPRRAVPEAPPRRSRRLAPALAAAAIVIVGLAGAAVLVLSNDDDESPAEVVASAGLEYDAATFDPLGADATARAELIGDSSGSSYELDLIDRDLPVDLATEPDALDLELWLIHPDANGEPVELVSLGLIEADEPGPFAVPEGYDPGEYSVVDISVEPRDGDPTHSGRSILRGALVE